MHCEWCLAELEGQPDQPSVRVEIASPFDNQLPAKIHAQTLSVSSRLSR
jgi:hypothetical protein